MELVKKLVDKYKQLNDDAWKKTDEFLDTGRTSQYPDEFIEYDKRNLFGKGSTKERFNVYKSFKKHPDILDNYAGAAEAHVYIAPGESGEREIAWKLMHDAIVDADLLKDDKDADNIRKVLKDSPYNSEQWYIKARREGY